MFSISLQFPINRENLKLYFKSNCYFKSEIFWHSYCHILLKLNLLELEAEKMKFEV